MYMPPFTIIFCLQKLHILVKFYMFWVQNSVFEEISKSFCIIFRTGNSWARWNHQNTLSGGQTCRFFEKMFLNKLCVPYVLLKFANKNWKSIISEEKKKGKACFADKDLSSWTGLGISGHVRSQTFGQISHISVPELTFWGNFIMVLHGFAWRSSKNTVLRPTTLKIRPKNQK